MFQNCEPWIGIHMYGICYLLHFAGCFVQCLGLGSSKLTLLFWFSVSVLGLNTVSKIFFSAMHHFFIVKQCIFLLLAGSCMFQIVLTLFCHVSAKNV